MSNLTDFIGSGAGYPFSTNKVEITASGTYVAPYTGDYIVFLVGGGGGAGGGASYAGGGGCGYLWNKIHLAKGEAVAITIGAGGVGVAGGNGGPGGSTSFGTYLTSIGASGGLHNSSTPTAGVNGGGDGATIGVAAGGYTIPNLFKNLTLKRTADNIGGSSSDYNYNYGGGAGAGGNGGAGGGGNGKGYGAGGGGIYVTGVAGGNGYQGVCIVFEEKQ